MTRIQEILCLALLLPCFTLWIPSFAWSQDCLDYAATGAFDVPLLWSLPGFAEPIDALTVGDWGYVVDHEGLKILDLSGGSEVRIHEAVADPRRLFEIELVGDRVYVTSEDGLRIWNVSDPSHPVAETPVLTGENTHFPTTDAGLLYVRAGSDLVRLDVTSSPPVETGRWPGPANNYGMAVVDSIAWIGGLWNIRAFDLRDGADGAEIPTGIHNDSEPYAGAVSFVSNRLLAQEEENWWPIGTYTGIYDISDPAAPVKIGRVYGGGRPHIDGDLMFLDGAVYDITDIDNPVEAGALDEFEIRLGHGFVVEIDRSFGIEVRDTSLPGLPVVAATPALGEYNRTVRDFDGVLRTTAGLWRLNTAGPPTLLTDQLPPGSLNCTRNDEALDGDTFYFAKSDTIVAYDVSHPDPCPEVGRFLLRDLFPDFTELLGFGVHEGIAYMGIRRDFIVQGKLYTVDVSVPSAPVVLDELALPNFFAFRGIQVDGDVMYLATQVMGLRSIDISNPADMVYLQSDAGASECVDIRLFGTTLVMVYDQGGAWYYDVSDPSAPLNEKVLSSVYYVHDAVVHGGRAYMIDRRDKRCSPGAPIARWDRIKVFDVSGFYPSLLATVGVPGELTSLFVTDDQLVVATQHGGWYGLPLDCGTVAVEPPPPAEPDAVPTALHLLPAVPNPFNPRTTISWEQAIPGHVTVEVYDLAGRSIATLTDGQRGVGRHAVIWDGCNDEGRGQAAGTYMVSLRQERARDVRKVVLVR